VTVRKNQIYLSDSEKQRLDDAAQQLLGTTDVPNGAVVSALIANELENSEK